MDGIFLDSQENTASNISGLKILHWFAELDSGSQPPFRVTLSEYEHLLEITTVHKCNDFCLNFIILQSDPRFQTMFPRPLQCHEVYIWSGCCIIVSHFLSSAVINGDFIISVNKVNFFFLYNALKAVSDLRKTQIQR